MNYYLNPLLPGGLGRVEMNYYLKLPPLISGGLGRVEMNYYLKPLSRFRERVGERVK
ncbi:hypothetical protein [Legionella norrlandica]|uniref:hypothetical protein n=1 Tax=Legionella norrlandica TaxID=1498499 RepID=UPI001364619C|nr:hypothetical protein [Legionella norrlandica]